ncbi:MAG TPA: hypothetical protein VFJ90_03325 [Candidatus Didemnitutus sp.]|nr:hypothetical protein [Candidatus Didemnitutus sp.]
MNGPPFIASVLADTDFRHDGFLQGIDGAIFYTVFDPKRHVVAMWMKKGAADAYEATAQGLGATVYTNGPQMDNPNVGKYTPHKIAAGAATTGVVVAVGLAKGLAWGFLAASGAGILVATVIVVAGVVYLNNQTTKFDPFSTVKGNGFTDDGRQYADWASFGRKAGTSFADYEMKMTGLPDDLPEVCGGMSPLVDNWQAFSSQPGTPNFNDHYQGAVGAAQMAAWALVPIPLPGTPITERGLQWPMIPVESRLRDDRTLIDGLIIAAGTGTESQRIAPCFAAVGARTATATDGSGSAMYGSGTETKVPVNKPYSWKARQELQKYGIAATKAP